MLEYSIGLVHIAPTIPRDAVMLEVNNHDSSDFLEERLAASLSVYYQRSAVLVVLKLSREASKQLASPGDNPA